MTMNTAVAIAIFVPNDPFLIYIVRNAIKIDNRIMTLFSTSIPCANNFHTVATTERYWTAIKSNEK
ncbi:hypothetical protein NY2A_b295L [Paramecium bursaria Chlorella virus NY2A]|uniref:Uncharacterized protein b295L n=1 Tax=Paramecium bursaria Chlorella virus NY2A TaxID=46021 RepID=A7IWH0_PBCVN|nr:hypothetical protein NY2A_b295L [Paramecium bursaria Chlorella virus NY2A]YP_001498355.1 hypothetical protein AR158_c274L [Paramecium bursaria Chlorella virus AR158]ABT14694.1 hypothetical protein NY2A_b295L [Paramecium bursaria Chlorella virus NY2A]ABU43819.1 hypothetical protein AR158_c274L [Paramecium bursaria Chlorella virus AR158]